MSIVNTYTPEPDIKEDELYGPDPYDIHFVLPIPPVLSTSKLQLVPFVPRVHAAAFLDATRGHEAMFAHICLPLELPTRFLHTAELFRRDPRHCWFAALDTTRPDADYPTWPGALAGLFGLLGTDTTHLATEIGPAVVLPAFQRTHVASHAVGLLLRYALELPPAECGFRKVRWGASPDNGASNRLAERMGFRPEGVMRWKFVLPAVEGYEKPGKAARAGDVRDGLLGRDSNEWAVCWDDWEEGGTERVERVFARVA